MATKSAILSVKIISDAKDFKKGTEEATSSIQRMGDKLKGMAIPALAAGAGLLKLGSDYVKMASDFQQQSGAVDAVFKGHSKEVDALANNSAKKLGLSATDYKEYSALIGSQMKNAGVPMEQLVGKTDGLINKGADLAAQFGGTVPDAISAMSSALKGEFDPMEKYGISMSAAKIDAEALAMGAKKVNGAFTDQAKQAAILSIIEKQSADAKGANAREAGTAAGVHARLTASYVDMGTKLGTMLLPVLVTLGDMLSKVIDWMTQNAELVGILAVALAALVAGILILNAAMIVMNIIAALNPWVILAVAVLALVGFIIYLATQTQFFQTVWAAVSKFCSDAWGKFVSFAKNVWNGFIGFAKSTLNNIKNFFSTVFGNIRNFVNTVLVNIRNYFVNAFNGARNIVSGVVNAITGFIGRVRSTAQTVLDTVRSKFTGVFNGAKNTVSTAISSITGFIDNISGAVRNAISWVRDLFNGFSIPGWLSSVMNFMGGGMTGADLTVGMDLTGLPAGMGASGGLFGGGVFGGPSGGKTEVNNYHITVNGALDSNAVAKQIKVILTGDATRNGKISAGGQLW